MAEGLTIGGVDVSTLAVRVIDLSGLLRVPERRGENLPVPGRHGDLRVPRKRYTGRETALEFWIRGAQADGTVPANPRAQFYDNLRTLGQLIGQQVVTLVHTLPDGTTRRIEAEALTAVDASRYKSGDLARIGVAFTSAAAFWEATATTTIGPFSLTAGSTRQLVELADTDAPIDDAIVTFGPGSNPVLTDLASGSFIAYDDVIASGRSVALDTSAWSGSGAGGLTYDRTKVRSDPRDGGWFTLDPAPGGPTVRLDHTGGGSAPVTLQVRKKWLFG